MAESSPAGRQGHSTGSSVSKASQESGTPRAPPGYPEALPCPQALTPIAEMSPVRAGVAVH